MPISLSPAQKAAVLGEGNFLLTACPGSGKTTSIAGRVAELSRDGKKVALLSYTRIARDELARSIESQHGVNLTNDSFVGTIHSFVAKFLIRPFAHVLTKAEVPVRVDQAAAAAYDPDGVDSRQLHFDHQGKLVPKSRSASSETIRKSYEARMLAAREGVVSFEDSLYWGRRVLAEVPNIARALAMRFDEIIVDEAQDATVSQLVMLKLLHDGGLKSLVMVGDFDQTIYGFAGSRPDLCRRLAVVCDLEERSLSENYRSSQAICDTTAQFRADKTPDLAVGEFKDLAVKPKLVTYQQSEVDELVRTFAGYREASPSPIRTAACLARNHELARRITGGGRFRPSQSAEVILKAARAPIPNLEDLREVESQILRRAFGNSGDTRVAEPLSVRERAMEFLRDLPELEGGIGLWLSEADRMLSEAARDLSGDAPSVPLRSIAEGVAKDINFDAFPQQSEDSLRVDSIHQAKGESIDAVLVAAGPQRGNWTPDAEVWARALTDSNADNEELRIFYVAITRARKLLVVALPAETKQSVYDQYLGAGFEVA